MKTCFKWYEIFFSCRFSGCKYSCNKEDKNHFLYPSRSSSCLALSSAHTTELVLSHYTLTCAFIIFSNLFFFLMRTKQSSNPVWILKSKSWNPVRECRVFCVLLPSLFSPSKIQLFFFRILVLFSRAGRNVTKNSHGVKGMTFKKDCSTIFVYFDGSWVFLKVIYNIGFKNISPFRMFLLKSFATENLPRQFKHNKTIVSVCSGRKCCLGNYSLW